jgi:hypothetical protein
LSPKFRGKEKGLKDSLKRNNVTVQCAKPSNEGVDGPEDIEP